MTQFPDVYDTISSTDDYVCEKCALGRLADQMHPGFHRVDEFVEEAHDLGLNSIPSEAKDSPHYIDALIGMSEILSRRAGAVITCLHGASPTRYFLHKEMAYAGQVGIPVARFQFIELPDEEDSSGPF